MALGIASWSRVKAKRLAGVPRVLGNCRMAGASAATRAGSVVRQRVADGGRYFRMMCRRRARRPQRRAERRLSAVVGARGHGAQD